MWGHTPIRILAFFIAIILNLVLVEQLGHAGHWFYSFSIISENRNPTFVVEGIAEMYVVYQLAETGIPMGKKEIKGILNIDIICPECRMPMLKRHFKEGRVLICDCEDCELYNKVFLYEEPKISLKLVREKAYG